jgi:DNA-binding LytR/AlgR family response regulator
MDMKTILIVEDNFLNRRLIKKYLVENNYQVIEAKNAIEAIYFMKTEKVDLAILDINLGEEKENGISLAETINQDFAIPFIFLTAYENMDVIQKAISTRPYSYLTKPFKNIDLINSIEIALRKNHHPPKEKPHIIVKDEDYNIKLSLDDILYIESDGNYLLFYTQLKKYKSRCTIKQILEVLPAYQFVQTHRAFIVNKTKIEKYNIRSVIIHNKTIPVSKNFVHHLSVF